LKTETETCKRPGSEVLQYIRAFAHYPEATGSLVPSSTALSREVVRGLDLARARAVLEYGPATGVFTPYILNEMSPEARFVAIELNPAFAAQFRRALPGVSVHEGSVADVREICDSYGIRHVDCIVSGLPWAAFSHEKQEQLLRATVDVLRPGGQFTTFACVHGLFVPSGRRFARMLRRHFSEVVTSRVVWRNFPPSVVYKCRL
jgi:phospholipid N-methyltransferase